MDKIIIIQLAALVFIYGSGRHDAAAITEFEHFGARPGPLAKFHRYNNWLKAGFCFCAAMAGNTVWEMLAYGGSAALLIYLLFDVVANLFREPKRPWYYLGQNDADGRFWLERGGGKLKAIIIATAYISTFITYFLIVKS